LETWALTTEELDETPRGVINYETLSDFNTPEV